MLARNFLEGGWREPAAGDTLEVRDPATGELLSWIPAGAEADTDTAVRAAEQAAPGWEQTPAAERAAALAAGAAALRERLDAVADLQAREGGVAASASRERVEAAVAALERAAGMPTDDGGASPGPAGVVAILAPAEDAVAVACEGVAAALVAGAVVVLKPAAQASLSTCLLVEAIATGLPAGVLNLVLGDDRVAATLAGHDAVAARAEPTDRG